MEIMERVKAKISAGALKVVFRYIVSGGTSVVVQFAALTVFVEKFHLDPTFSSASAFIMGCVVNYLMLYYWTFQANGKHIVVVLKYALVTSMTLLLNILIFWTLTEPLGIWYIYSQVFATGAVAAINFLINQRYTFPAQVSRSLLDSKVLERHEDVKRRR